MELSDFVKLGLNEHYGKDEVLEIRWATPDIDSPPLTIRRGVDGIPLDPNLGDRGSLLGYYLRLVRELREEYREGNVEPPFIEVSLTRERNYVANNNMVQIPLNYIRSIVQLGKGN